MRKKVCRNCRVFVDGKTCPLCNGTDLTTTWKGRINIIDVRKSEIAQRIGINVKGEYAIKTT